MWEEVCYPLRQEQGALPIDTTKESPSGEFRKLWKEQSEELLQTLQRSAASLTHTPTEVALCALMVTEIPSRQAAAAAIVPRDSMQSSMIYPDYGLQAYLVARFGATEATALWQQAQEVSRFVDIVSEADRDDTAFKQVMDTIRKASVWGAKKEKKEKVAKQS